MSDPLVVIAPLTADYGQFKFVFEEAHDEDLVELSGSSSAHILGWIGEEWLAFVAYLAIPGGLRIELHAQRPGELDASWGEVAEISVIARGVVVAQSRAAAERDGTVIPIPVDEPYRLRYGVAGLAATPVVDELHYVVQIWPETIMPGVTVRSDYILPARARPSTSTLVTRILAPIASDFGQFRFTFEGTDAEDVELLAEGNNAPTVEWIDAEWLALYTHQPLFGDLPIEVYSERPVDLGEGWGAVAEISVVARGQVLAQNLATRSGTVVPVPRDVPHRLRFARSGNTAWTPMPGVEYLVQLWPEPVSPGVLVRSRNDGRA